MTEDKRAAITEERFDNYRRQLRNEHATPFLCIGMVHTRDENWGKLVLCTVKDVSNKDMAAIFRQLATDLERNSHEGQNFPPNPARHAR